LAAAKQTEEFLGAVPIATFNQESTQGNLRPRLRKKEAGCIHTSAEQARQGHQAKNVQDIVLNDRLQELHGSPPEIVEPALGNLRTANL
jgi:hypothetical protein